jgi:hypothetical protein
MSFLEPSAEFFRRGACRSIPIPGVLRGNSQDEPPILLIVGLWLLGYLQVGVDWADRCMCVSQQFHFWREPMQDQPNPGRILQTGLSFWPAKTLLSAVELGLFTELARAPASLAALQERLQLHPRAARDFWTRWWRWDS